MKKWDEKLADLSADLADLSQKAADASEEAKASRELRQAVMKDRISTVKGNVVAFQERMRLAGEEERSKFSSALLKAQMTVEAKIQQRREEKDRRAFEKYIDDQINYICESFETASYLISKAQLAILETEAAIEEYEAKYETAEEDSAEETQAGVPEDAEKAEEAKTEEAETAEEAKEEEAEEVKTEEAGAEEAKAEA